MAKVDFDTVINRGVKSCSYSSKHQGFESSFPGYDVKGAIPMWVADMDFPCAKEITKAVVKRAEHGIYGYVSSDAVDEFKTAARNWYSKRYGWDADESWMIYVPAVVPAICTAVQELTDEGDGVIIQTPVYFPFIKSINNNHRVIKENKLIEKDGVYSIDFDNFEKLAAEKDTKLFILCSPHNPVGRVWTKAELKKMVAICRKYDVAIFSDEIHADLMIDGHKHISLGTLTKKKDNVVIACSPSKTFNLAGLQASLMIAQNPEIKKRIETRSVANRLPYNNIFGPIAAATAYSKCEYYADQLCEYITDNYHFALDFCRKYMSDVTISPLEGTYLAWFDFRKTGIDYEEIIHIVLEKAKVAGDIGGWFGDTGVGFIRFNLACPRSVLEKALKRIAKAINAYRGNK